MQANNEQNDNRRVAETEAASESRVHRSSTTTVSVAQLNQYAFEILQAGIHKLHSDDVPMSFVITALQDHLWLLTEAHASVCVERMRKRMEKSQGKPIDPADNLVEGFDPEE